MSSRSSSPSSIPFRFRRKSSSATSMSLDDSTYTREDTAFSSPIPSSSPLTPLRSTRAYEYTQWENVKYEDDVVDISYDDEDGIDAGTSSWSRYRRDDKRALSSYPLPSLMTKLTTQVLSNQPPSSFQSPLYAACRSTSYFYPYGESALADDCEEYDLESMDIRVRETYFATSSERGRWLSSPIATRVRTQTISPRHGQSSPVQKPVEASPSAPRVCRRITSPLSDRDLSNSSSSEDHDDHMRFSSPLPPSSPLTSPISYSSFLPDGEDNKIVNSFPPSNPTGCPMNVSPIAHTSSVGSTCPLVQSESPDTDPGHKCSNSVSLSRSQSPCPSHMSMSVDTQVVSPGFDVSGSKLDSLPSSPLSVFDDLPPAEPIMPLSNTKNMPHFGQRACTPDGLNIALGTASFTDIPLVHPLPVDAEHESQGAIVNSSVKVFTKKRKVSAPDLLHQKKRAAIQLCASLSDLREEAQKRRPRVQKESHVSDAWQPAKKKSTLPDRNSHPDHCPTKSSRRRKTSHTSKPFAHSQPGIKVDCMTMAPLDKTVPDTPPVDASTSLDPMDPAEAEFRASLTGMLIEVLATSRATCMDSSALYLAVTQTHPHLVKERPKEELQILIANVLESERTRCGMFEKVDSSGEASRHKALESRWFYVPDCDEDRERASLISAIMPRQKRSETKKYKQYYYRPLDKISRWDPEDAP